MAYKDKWDETRIKMAHLLIDGLLSGRGYHYYPSQIARVLAVYPHPSIRAKMQEALQKFEDRHADFVERARVSDSVSYDNIIVELNRVVEDLKRGLRK